MYFGKVVSVGIGLKNIKMVYGIKYPLKTKVIEAATINAPSFDLFANPVITGNCISNLVGSFITQMNIKVVRLRFSIPDKDIIKTNVKMPAVKAKYIKSNIIWDMEQLPGFDTEEYCLSWKINNIYFLGKNKMYDVSAYAVPIEKIETCINAANNLMLNTDAIYVENCSIDTAIEAIKCGKIDVKGNFDTDSYLDEIGILVRG